MVDGCMSSRLETDRPRTSAPPRGLGPAGVAQRGTLGRWKTLYIRGLEGDGAGPSGADEAHRIWEASEYASKTIELCARAVNLRDLPPHLILPLNVT